MNSKTCFFIGSRHATNRIQPQLAEAVDKHIIEYGVTSFTVGHYGSFDSLVIGVLNEAKIPEEKSGPSNIKNSLIGLAIGIILSGIMLTIRVLTDTKVKTEEEVRAIFDYPIIGVIPDVDLSKYNKGDRSDD